MLRYRAIPGDAEKAVVEAVVQHHRGSVVWQCNASPVSAYALIEDAGAECIVELAPQISAEIIDSPVIALAVSPREAEALPFLYHALGGPGRPAGVVRCETKDGTLAVEWDMSRTAAPIMMALIDVELSRFGGGRSTRVLAPIPLAWSTDIAARGLQAPEIAPGRVLEELLETHGVLD